MGRRARDRPRSSSRTMLRVQLGSPGGTRRPGDRAAGRRAAEAPGDRPADVAVIGAGVVGTAIARALALADVSCVLIDAANDVGTGTSKANTAILHTGFDAVPGSLESRLLRRGSVLLADYARRAGIPVERTGALLVAWTPEQQGELPAIEDKARRNGVTDVRRVGISELYRRGPHHGRRAPGARRVPLRRPL